MTDNILQVIAGQTQDVRTVIDIFSGSGIVAPAFKQATQMTIIAPNDRSKVAKFEQEIEKSAFASIKERVRFYNYDYVVALYNSQVEANRFSDF